MAITVANIKAVTDGPGRVRTFQITLDSSYATGGESLTAAMLGLYAVDLVMLEGDDGYVLKYDYTNSKVQAFWVDTTVDGAPLAEAASTTNLSAVVSRGLVVGT